MTKEVQHWVVCPECQGRGRKRRRLRKKVRLSYQRAVDAFEGNNGVGEAPVRPRGQLYGCLSCQGSGLVGSDLPALVDESFPHVAIIGGGIGGVALAVACQHRGIPFTLYERDSGFDARSQGYGLTLQQASKAIEGLGILALEEGVTSTRHVVHTVEGKVIGEWGVRKWLSDGVPSSNKRRNVHIARQSLRLALLEQLVDQDSVQWGHQLMGIKDIEGEGVELSFQVGDEVMQSKADLVVGADGIRSSVRKLVVGEEVSPLRYLGCLVILGICPLRNLAGVESSLLDSATVFQTANGNERIYVMPYSADSVMWQLSFPMEESEAKALSAQGAHALKREAQRRTQWHEPVPQILAATEVALISGYPVYDRALLEPELLQNSARVTLLGDAAHPMSPFKGQGANQALLDALALARGIFIGCRPLSLWREHGVRESVLSEFESEMLERSGSKVKDSADAAEFLHSETVLHEGDEPRGRCLKKRIVDDFVAPRCEGVFEILYQDEDILVINKPSGLLSLSGKNPLNLDSVHYRLVHGQEGSTPAFPEAKLPHRLDFGTSGVMVVGLNAASSKHLNKQFQERTVEKSYVAVLDGWIAEDQGVISAPIAKDKELFPRVKICEASGKPAISEYQVIRRLEEPRRTVVKFMPHTGRTHQLRIHSLSIGHPIQGCDLYKNAQSESQAARLMLHATDLYFDHPASGERFHGKCTSPF